MFLSQNIVESDYISSAAATIFGNFDTSIEEQNVTEYAVIKHIRPKGKLTVKKKKQTRNDNKKLH